MPQKKLYFARFQNPSVGSARMRSSIYTQNLKENLPALNRMFRMRFSTWTIAGSLILTGSIVLPIRAQLPIPNFDLRSPNLLERSEPIASACVRLYGRCVFEVAAPRSDLSERVEDIEQRLRNIGRTYFKNESAQLEFRVEQDGNLPNIYVSAVDEQGDVLTEVRLMSVTDQDANLEGLSIEARADQIIEQLEEELRQARQERQPEYLTRQGVKAAGIGVAMLVTLFVLHRWERHLKREKQELLASETASNQPVSTQLSQQQQRNLTEVQHRLFQLAEIAVVGGGSLLILGLFPYTRMLQVLIFQGIRIPLRFGLVGVGTYIVVRLTYALIDRFTAVLARNRLLTPEADRRMQLRVSTISGVTRGVVTVTWIAIGILVALSAIGVDIGPLLAGAGIIGLAVSLASQNLIKDAINGFLIILEDQYAVGDVITVKDIGGFVENINLRITQLRDPEGRLITIPNSEIQVVANHSNGWSRADLNIPIAYYQDIDKALQLVRDVAQNMSKDEFWREHILDKPDILGVDDFGERGLIVRVWIKTQPLKQWDVAREFRRRMKVAFDEAGMPIPTLQQEIWFRNSGLENLPRPVQQSLQDGQGDSSRHSTNEL
jgi:small conductance mechanosensitive channel